MTLTVHADRHLVRAGARSRRFLCAEIQAPEAPPKAGRRPVNLAFVLDRSGSMHGEKIARAREAVLQGLRSLHDEDRFAVVAYDQEIVLVVPTRPHPGREAAIAVPHDRTSTAAGRRAASRSSSTWHRKPSAAASS